MRILFICHGNICRSPMAEFIMKNMAAKAFPDTDIYIESAATSFEEIGNDMYPPAKRKLRQMSVPFSPRAARRIMPEDYERFDLLIGMDSRNITNINKIVGGDPHGKVRLLLSFAGVERDISDPWYTGDFDRTYDDITTGCDALLRTLKLQ